MGGAGGGLLGIVGCWDEGDALLFYSCVRRYLYIDIKNAQTDKTK